MRTRPRPPFVDPHQAEDYWVWVEELRLEARRHIFRLRPGTLYAIP